jgi:hypothetical protein
MLVSAAVLSALALGLAVPALAEEEVQYPQIWPMEIYGCTFRDGQGMAQLTHVADRWNAWMDKTGQNDYWAYILMPFFHSSDFPFDVLWAGGWPSGAAMGTGLERWLTEGVELAAEFSRVVDCSGHTNFAVMDLTRTADSPPPPASGPVAFSDCKVAEGRQFAEAMKAVQDWIAYEREQGITADHFMLFPAYGESSDAKYTFKWVTTSTWAELGKGYDQYGNGGGWQKGMELFGGLLDCDSSRLYQSNRVRAIKKAE